ncbi:MAG: 5'-methylthioadenosine phosphorylase, partial [Methylococcales bacterium]|nr:5'-methylthioadenosine phosphorylase [Methylococcales bacterium]
MSDTQVLGIIGGSGLYEIDGLQNTSWQKFTSAFGEPSDALLCGELNGQKI